MARCWTKQNPVVDTNLYASIKLSLKSHKDSVNAKKKRTKTNILEEVTITEVAKELQQGEAVSSTTRSTTSTTTTSPYFSTPTRTSPYFSVSPARLFTPTQQSFQSTPIHYVTETTIEELPTRGNPDPEALSLSPIRKTPTSPKVIFAVPQDTLTSDRNVNEDPSLSTEKRAQDALPLRIKKKRAGSVMKSSYDNNSVLGADNINRQINRVSFSDDKIKKLIQNLRGIYYDASVKKDMKLNLVVLKEEGGMLKLVENLEKFGSLTQSSAVVDLGFGTGAIAVILKKEFGIAKIDCYDWNKERDQRFNQNAIAEILQQYNEELFEYSVIDSPEKAQLEGCSHLVLHHRWEPKTDIPLDILKKIALNFNKSSTARYIGCFYSNEEMVEAGFQVDRITIGNSERLPYFVEEKKKSVFKTFYIYQKSRAIQEDPEDVARNGEKSAQKNKTRSLKRKQAESTPSEPISPTRTSPPVITPLRKVRRVTPAYIGPVSTTSTTTIPTMQEPESSLPRFFETPRSSGPRTVEELFTSPVQTIPPPGSAREEEEEEYIQFVREIRAPSVESAVERERNRSFLDIVTELEQITEREKRKREGEEGEFQSGEARITRILGNISDVFTTDSDVEKNINRQRRVLQEELDSEEKRLKNMKDQNGEEAEKSNAIIAEKKLALRQSYFRMLYEKFNLANKYLKDGKYEKALSKAKQGTKLHDWIKDNKKFSTRPVFPDTDQSERSWANEVLDNLEKIISASESKIADAKREKLAKEREKHETALGRSIAKEEGLEPEPEKEKKSWKDRIKGFFKRNKKNQEDEDEGGFDNASTKITRQIKVSAEELDLVVLDTIFMQQMVDEDYFENHSEEMRRICTRIRDKSQRLSRTNEYVLPADVNPVTNRGMYLDSYIKWLEYSPSYESWSAIDLAIFDKLDHFVSSFCKLD